jgi:hypothetical protein
MSTAPQAILPPSVGLKRVPHHGGPNVCTLVAGETVQVTTPLATWARVRVLSGPHAGLSGWLLATALGPVPASRPFGAWNGSGWDTKAVETFKTRYGTYPAITMWYQSWGGNDFPGWGESGNVDWGMYGRLGILPQVAWMPQIGTGWPGHSQSEFTCSLIAGGAFDAFITAWATSAKAIGLPFLLRFAFEMNGDWTSWGCQAGNQNGNVPADYVAMWKHVWGIFQGVGATNVKWIWSPNVDFHGAAPLAACYPGDAWVDYVALDGYNRGSNPGHTWQTFAEVFEPSLVQIRAFTSKPFLVGEMGCVEQGGDKAAWLEDAFTVQADRLNIGAMVYFDAATDYAYDLNTSPASSAATARIAASPGYRGRWQGFTWTP